MSNRTLIEINHDYASQIDSVDFLDALLVYLRSGSIAGSRDELQSFGVTLLGQRHHSEAYGAESIQKLGAL